MSRRKHKKLPGRFCWCCDRRRPNERFSRKRSVCSDCAKLGQAEIAYRQEVRNIDHLLTWNGCVRGAQRRTFQRYLTHPDARVQAYAMEVAALQREDRQERRETATGVLADEVCLVMLWYPAEEPEEPEMAGDEEIPF